MPTYVYEHLEGSCDLGEQFEIRQSISEPRLTQCPKCAKPVKRIISRTFVSTPTTDAELKSKGFTKLVRRDKGVYENVTATDKESRYFHPDRPDKSPKSKKGSRG